MEGNPQQPANPPGPAPESAGAMGSQAPPATSGEAAPATRRGRGRGRAQAQGNMLPGRERRRLGLERLLVRLVATGGVIGVGVALGAILSASKVQGWIMGLVIALVSVILSGILWSSRQL